ncbi:MAG: hypothetical protein RL459_643 [Pseudomonadota bacterium]
MLPDYVFLDLETTGGNPVSDRITEVALVRMTQEQEVARWSTLINPGTPIPRFITGLTGISDEMVAEAPSFAEIAKQLLALLEGAVLAAHNVRFDHGFLKNEFARCEVDLRVKTLCTVRLSRKLYPQHRSHGLDAIMQRHGLHTVARHRAMGDVDMVLAWLNQAQNELGAAKVRAAAQALLTGSASLPPQLETPMQDIPDGPGVYLFYGEGALPLYVGKSVNLRTRVLSHFQADHKVAREMRLAQETRRVEWRQTAGELGALLLESRLVKELQPMHNRQLRRENDLWSWRLADDPGVHPPLTLVRGDEFEGSSLDQLYGVYRSRKQATEALRELAEVHLLCLQNLGLESSRGRCFGHQLGRCKGVCCGQEAPERHYLRLQLAFAAQRLKAWPFSGKVGLREHDPRTGRTDIHVFEQWRHLATVHNESDLADVVHTRSSLAFDLDTYRLLIKRLLVPGEKLIPL